MIADVLLVLALVIAAVAFWYAWIHDRTPRHRLSEETRRRIIMELHARHSGRVHHGPDSKVR